MNKNLVHTLKKKFSTLGEIEYKMASTPQELEAALSLVYKEYEKRGLIRANNYKHPIRISPQHILPSTKVFIGLKDGEVIITLSTFYDSPLGLPLDQGYREEFQTLRNQRRKIAEAGYLAVKSGLFRGKRSLLVKLERLNFIRTIIIMAIQYALYHTDTDDACFVTWPAPKRALLKYFPVETIGEIKHYGFDEKQLDPKPAIAKRINFRDLHPSLRNVFKSLELPNALFRIVLGPKMPANLFQNNLKMEKKDLIDLFFEKSDVLKNLKPDELRYVLSRYKMDQNDFEILLTQV